MSTLAIYADSRGPGHCRSCGAPIEWAELTSGGRVPFDQITPIREQPALVPGARVVLELELASSPSHLSTCPYAKGWHHP